MHFFIIPSRFYCVSFAEKLFTAVPVCCAIFRHYFHTWNNGGYYTVYGWKKKEFFPGIAACDSGHSDFGLLISNFRLEEIRNPQSQIRN